MTTYAKKLSLLIIIIVLVGIGLYYSRKTTTVDVPIVENPTTVSTTTPLSGCYVAKLAKDVYTLDIETQKNGTVSGVLAFNNYEKDSSSGTFTGSLTGDILRGTYSFYSEGMKSKREVVFKHVGNSLIEGFGTMKTEGDTEVFEDIGTVSFDSKSTFVSSPTCTEHFTDATGTTAFDYNSFFTVEGGSSTLTKDWKIEGVQKGTLLATLSIPRTTMPQTNFAGVKLTVGRSHDALAIKSCASVGVNEKKEGTSTIGGHSFTKITSGDAGAGNLYATTSYRGVVGSDCYVIEYTVHSLNIGNYSTEQGVTEYSKTDLQKEITKIIDSFVFTAPSN